MAINVYGWRKPTLELELVEGGSLLANTKYYVTGFMRFTPQTYNCVSSPFSDVYEITTTSTARSIKITQKTYRDITEFSDSGSGTTICASYRHCLDDGDEIKISTGSYTGTWAITKIDYHTFSIATSYIDNVAVQCYTDNYRYNMPISYSGTLRVGMLYWVHTTPPFDENDNFIQATKSHFTERCYQYEYSVQNPVTISAPLTNETSNSGSDNLEKRNFDKGIFQTMAKEYGLVFVRVEDEDVTLQSINEAVQNSGFIYNSFYNENTYIGEHFNFFGSLFLKGTSTLAVRGAWLNFYFSELAHIDYSNQLVFESCLLNMIPLTFTAEYKFTANDCVLFNKGSSNNYGGWVYGDNTIFYSMPRPSYSAGSCDIPSLKYNNLWDNTQGNYGIIQNKKYYNDLEAAIVFQVSYNYNKLINCEVPSLYWLSSYEKGCIPDIYMGENLTIRKTYNSWDYRFYTNAEGILYNHHFKYLNVNVLSNSTNVKKCVHNYAISSTAYLEADFYRRVIFNIKNQEGLTIEGADVKITDNAGNLYIGTTDSSGYTFIDCLEQKTYFTDDLSRSNWSSDFDTYYTGFTITITKAGYENEIIKLDKLYQEGFYDTVLQVSLNRVSVKISGILITDCAAIGSSNGQLQITAEAGTQPYEYSLDGITYQSSDTFTGLADGTYSIYVRDANDNIDTISGIKIVEPPYENNPKIDSVDILDASDKDKYDGQITVNASGINTPIIYSINGVDYQSSNVFSNLNTNYYTVYIKDVRNNIVTMSNIFIGYPQVVVNTVTTTEYIPLSDYIPTYDVDEGPDSLIYRRVIDAQGYRCPICSIRNVWNKQTLYFNWHYVDGNNKNKAVTNLRLICSNCKSQFK